MTKKKSSQANQAAVNTFAAKKNVLHEAVQQVNRSGSFRTDPRIQLFSEYSADTKHIRSYEDYGYQHTLTFQDFYFMYERFGFASAVVNVPVAETWKDVPRITDNEKSKEPTPWEAKVNKLLRRIDFWPAIRELDRRQRVGRWGGLYLEIRDGINPQRPADVHERDPSSLVRLRPLYEQQLQPIEFDTENYSNNYGDPKMWQFQETNLGDRNEDTGRSMEVNPDRVIYWSEGSGDGTIYGKSALKSTFNALVTLFKLIGAGGEGFYKNARGAQFFGIDKDVQVTEQFIDSLDDTAEDFARGMEKILALQGVNRETIQVALDDPKPFFEMTFAEVAADQRYPMTVLLGNQTGRLASEEDQKQSAKTTKERQDNFAGPALRKIIDHFIRLGFIEPAEYEVVFPDVFAPSDEQKVGILKQLMEVSKISRESGGVTIDLASALAKFGLDDLILNDDAESEDLGDDENELGAKEE